MRAAADSGWPGDSVMLLVGGVMVGGMLIAGLVIGVMVWTFTAGSRARVPVAKDGTVRLQARVYRPSEQFSPAAQLDEARYGVVTVTGQELIWASNTGQVWRTPLPAVAVTALHGGMAMTSSPSVDVEIAGAGPWRFETSDKRINRFVTNDFKRFREGGMARMFADTLIARGAVDRRR